MAVLRYLSIVILSIAYTIYYSSPALWFLFNKLHSFPGSLVLFYSTSGSSVSGVVSTVSPLHIGSVNECASNVSNGIDKRVFYLFQLFQLVSWFSQEVVT